MNLVEPVFKWSVRGARSCRRASPAALCGILAAVLVTNSGCRAPSGAAAPGARVQSGSRLSQAELREKLAAFYVEFVNALESATENAAVQTKDLELRRRLIEGRIRAVRSCREMIFQRQPLAAFVDTWSLCIRLDSYFASDEGRQRFGDAQTLMLSATHRLRDDVTDLGKLFLKTNELAELKQKLEGFAREHPFSMQYEVAAPSRDALVAVSQFGWLLDLPLSPFRAFQGVDQTAQAVHELTFVAGEFAQSVSDMPRELAWQTELLLMHTRREVTGLLAELDERQTNTQSTLQHARLALADTEHALKAATEMSRAVDATLKTYVQMMKDLYPPKPESERPKETPGRPFDILDYARTAEQVSGTITNLQQLLLEFQRTMETNAITERIKEVQTSATAALTDAQTSARQLADHVTKRVIQVVAFLVLALLVYRAVARRIGGPSPAKSQTKA